MAEQLQCSEIHQNMLYLIASSRCNKVHASVNSTDRIVREFNEGTVLL